MEYICSGMLFSAVLWPASCNVMQQPARRQSWWLSHFCFAASCCHAALCGDCCRPTQSDQICPAGGHAVQDVAFLTLIVSALQLMGNLDWGRAVEEIGAAAQYLRGQGAKKVGLQSHG